MFFWGGVGTDLEIEFSKKQVIARLETLKSMKYSLDPVRDSHFGFDATKLNSFCETIEHFGQIVQIGSCRRDFSKMEETQRPIARFAVPSPSVAVDYRGDLIVLN